MKPSNPDPTAERLTAGLFVAFFAGYGWFALWQQQVAIKGKSGASSLLTGNAALAAVAIAFVLSALALAFLLRSWSAGRLATIAAVTALVVPPFVYALVRA